MKALKNLSLLLLLVLAFTGCHNKSSKLADFNRTVYTPEYASGFDIKGADGKKSVLVTVTNPWQGADSITTNLFIARDDEEVPADFTGQMLKGDAEPVDLPALREQLFARCAEGIAALQQRFGLQAIQPVHDVAVTSIQYPITAYPAKINSFNLDKDPVAEGTLLGIKGQYLMFDSGVINIRKYTAYQLAIHEIAA